MKRKNQRGAATADKPYKALRITIAFGVMVVLLLAMTFFSMNTGTIQVGGMQLLKGLFVSYDETVATVVDLRFPRIVLSLLAGAAVSVSGVLLQAMLKNPLADPGIIGISAGAGFFAVVATALAPTLYALTPIVAFGGGIVAFGLVYALAWKDGASPLRILLVGVAIEALFSGLGSALNTMTGSSLSGVASIVEGNITQKTWSDVTTLLPYVAVGLLLSLLFAGTCNLFALEDTTIRGLGINVDRMRILVSLVAVLLAAISTAVVGAVAFLGLIVPHMGRLIVGSNHKVLLPFSMLLGAFVFLLADTIGRTIAYPYEISAAIIMSVVGGPFFILLLRRSKKYGH